MIKEEVIARLSFILDKTAADQFDETLDRLEDKASKRKISASLGFRYTKKSRDNYESYENSLARLQELHSRIKGALSVDLGFSLSEGKGAFIKDFSNKEKGSDKKKVNDPFVSFTVDRISVDNLDIKGFSGGSKEFFSRNRDSSFSLPFQSKLVAGALMGWLTSSVFKQGYKIEKEQSSLVGLSGLGSLNVLREKYDSYLNQKNERGEATPESLILKDDFFSSASMFRSVTGKGVSDFLRFFPYIAQASKVFTRSAQDVTGAISDFVKTGQTQGLEEIGVMNPQYTEMLRKQNIDYTDTLRYDSHSRSIALMRLLKQPGYQDRANNAEVFSESQLPYQVKRFEKIWGDHGERVYDQLQPSLVTLAKSINDLSERIGGYFTKEERFSLSQKIGALGAGAITLKLGLAKLSTVAIPTLFRSLMGIPGLVISGGAMAIPELLDVKKDHYDKGKLDDGFFNYIGKDKEEIFKNLESWMEYITPHFNDLLKTIGIDPFKKKDGYNPQFDRVDEGHNNEVLSTLEKSLKKSPVGKTRSISGDRIDTLGGTKPSDTLGGTKPSDLMIRNQIGSGVLDSQGDTSSSSSIGLSPEASGLSDPVSVNIGESNLEVNVSLSQKEDLVETVSRLVSESLSKREKEMANHLKIQLSSALHS